MKCMIVTASSKTTINDRITGRKGNIKARVIEISIRANTTR